MISKHTEMILGSVLAGIVLTIVIGILAAIFISAGIQGADFSQIGIEVWTALALGVLAYLILFIASFSRKKYWLYPAILLVLGLGVSSSLVNDISSIFGLVALFQASLYQGIAQSIAYLSDFVALAALLYYSTAILKDNGQREGRIAVILLLTDGLISLVYVILTVIAAFAGSGDLSLLLGTSTAFLLYFK
jgi:hypothetical protein